MSDMLHGPVPEGLVYKERMYGTQTNLIFKHF